MSATDVINFWFEEATSKKRFTKDLDFDDLIRTKFLTLHKRVRNDELYSWRKHLLDSLAEIIVLDQFSRNICRDSPKSFTYDNLALVLT